LALRLRRQSREARAGSFHMVIETASDAQRRLKPRPWDHDFLLMREMASALRQMIAQQVKPGPHTTVVDYGCGPMPYRPLFTCQGAKYIGADLESNQLADVHLTESGGLPLGEASADVVVSSQVLEHVVDVESYLAECRRVLNTSGVLILSTHGSWIYHPHPTDVRRWTRWGLKFDIERCGFAVLDVIAVMGPLAYGTQLHLLMCKGLLIKLGLPGRLLAGCLSLLCQGLMWFEERLTPAWVTADNAVVYVVAARKS
jgi:SAM-dependent methyltransferase